MTIFLIVAIAITVLIGLGIAYLVWLLCRKLEAGVALVMLLFVWETLSVSLPGIILKLIVYPQDFVFLVLGLAALIRILLLKKFLQTQIVWLAFGFFLFSSLAIGLVRFGTGAGVEFREYFYFWAGTAYFLSFPGKFDRFAFACRWWIFASLVCVATAVFRWSADALGLEMGVAWQAVGARTPFRVLNAAQTFLLSQGLLILVCKYFRERLSYLEGLMIPIFLVSILILQHRSVWFSVLASLLLVVLFDKSARRKLAGGIGILVFPLGVFVLALLFVNGSNDVVNSVASSAVEVGASRSSLTWRIDSWAELLNSWIHSGPVQYLFGEPFGSGFARFIEGVEGPTVEAPHNYYVQTLLRVGLIGTLVFLGAYWLVFSDLRHKTSDNKLTGYYVLPVLLFSQLVFYTGYSASYVQCVLMGFALLNVRQDNSVVKEHSRLINQT